MSLSGRTVMQQACQPSPAGRQRHLLSPLRAVNARKDAHGIAPTAHGTSPSAAPPKPTSGGPVFTVTLDMPHGQHATIRAGANASILDIASFAGLHLPASCKQGACTACCGKVLSGHVKQPKQSCLPPELVQEGYVALCCATPTSDVHIQTHQGPAVRKRKAGC